MKRIYTKLSVIAVILMIIPFTNTYATKHVVSVANFAFAPTAIPNVAVGDTIRWVWVSGTHTTTSTTIPSGAATWNSSITSTITSFEYKVTVAGIYNYKCTPHATSMGMVATFTATDATRIQDVSSVFGNLQLSPNPASEFVRVSFNPSIPFKGSVKLFDLLGNSIWESESSFDAGMNLTEINLAFLPKGIYFVALSDDRNNRLVKRLIVR
jgi:plastocyanin